MFQLISLVAVFICHQNTGPLWYVNNFLITISRRVWNGANSGAFQNDLLAGLRDAAKDGGYFGNRRRLLEANRIVFAVVGVTRAAPRPHILKLRRFSFSHKFSGLSPQKRVA